MHAKLCVLFLSPNDNWKCKNETLVQIMVGLSYPFSYPDVLSEYLCLIQIKVPELMLLLWNVVWEDLFKNLAVP